MNPTMMMTTGVDIKLSLIDLLFSVVGIFLNFFTGMVIPDLFNSIFGGLQALFTPVM